MSKVNFVVKLNRIIFESNNGYKIAKCISTETSDEITLVGHFMPMYNDEIYSGYGKLTNHPNYGEQIEVETIEQDKISDEIKLVEYFSSGLFFGIGEKTATKIVDKLGENAIEMIIDNKFVLDGIPNLSERKSLKLHSKLVELNSTDNVFNYLLSLGLSQKISSKLYSDYGDKIKKILNDDPFQIYYQESNKYSFKTVYELSKNLKISNDDIRVTSATLYNFINNYTFNSGNTYVTYDELSNNLLNIEESIKFLSIQKILYVENEMISIYKLYNAELTISNFVKNSIKDNERDKFGFNFEKELSQFCKSEKINFSSKQTDAIRSSLENKISIITGGPGTGKTTIINAICNIYINKFNIQFGETIFDNELILLAPTGRAAKRMSEQSGIVASTIHRYLKWDMDKNTFEYNIKNKSNAKVVIIDEMSMVDTYLAASLIDALNSEVVIIIIGDDMQLPAVGCGDILNDLISSGIVNVTTLVDVYRQNSDTLLELMHQVRNFSVPNDLTSKYIDRNFIRCNNNQIFESLKKVLMHVESKKMGIYDFQLLIPMYKGDVGIDNVNRMCQNIFNKESDDKKELKVGERIFRVGDKVLLTKNFPNENVYNGDLGIIKDVSYNGKFNINIMFDSGKVEFVGEDVYSLVHGYAISIHKSQGSEFNHVIIPISLNHKTMLKHNLIYTGITRAKCSLLLIGEESTFVNTVCDKSILRRKTLLKTMLRSVEMSPFDFL